MKRVGAGGAMAVGFALGLWLGACTPDATVSVPPSPPPPGPAEDAPPPVTLLPVIPDPAEAPPALAAAPELVDSRPKPFVAKPCPDIFADDQLQTFEVVMAEDDWRDMRSEFRSWAALKAAGQPLEVYRPLTSFTHNGRTVPTGAMIRLRGNPNFWLEQEKMQFQISFNETNPDGRYMGLRKIVLDSAHYNRSYLRDRLAMSMARDAGLAAPCVNHAVLYVNGELYGLYTHLEKVDREFLERNFEDPSANLYKEGKELVTNEDENPDTSRMSAFWNVRTIAELEGLSQLRQLVRAWAMEAIFPDADGYWAGGENFYLYDEPEKGFAYLLWDIDLAFNNLPADTDPMTWHKQTANYNERPQYDLVMADPKWRREFVRELRSIRDTMEISELQSRLDRWSVQIRQAAMKDPHAPWTFADHLKTVGLMREHVAARLAFLDRWLACWEKHEDDEDFRGTCP